MAPGLVYRYTCAGTLLQRQAALVSQDLYVILLLLVKRDNHLCTRSALREAQSMLLYILSIRRDNFNSLLSQRRLRLVYNAF